MPRVSYNYCTDPCVDTRRAIDVDRNLPSVKNIQLSTLPKQATGELLNDEHNADVLCRLVEHGKANLLLLLSLLTHLEIFSREMMQFDFSLTQSESRHMH